MLKIVKHFPRNSKRQVFLTFPPIKRHYQKIWYLQTCWLQNSFPPLCRLQTSPRAPCVKGISQWAETQNAFQRSVRLLGELSAIYSTGSLTSEPMRRLRNLPMMFTISHAQRSHRRGGVGGIEWRRLFHQPQSVANEVGFIYHVSLISNEGGTGI